MLKAQRLTADTTELMRASYQRFASMAQTQYRWDTPAIPWEMFEFSVYKGFMEGYLLVDSSRPSADAVCGFCLYKLEAHQAVEINVIHLDRGTVPKVALDALMKPMIKHLLTREGWDVISYALLGLQEGLVQTLPWYGFKPMGQSIVKFNMLDPISTQVFANQQALAPVSTDYRLVHWDDQYAEATGQAIYEAFHTKSDALWDPRFRTPQGGQTVVRLITENEMGSHLKDCTSLLIRQADEQVVGFCFLVQTDVTVGNIPLIGLLPSVAGQGLGNQLLRHMMHTCIGHILEGRVGMAEINATSDTDNHAAIHMYRRFGFVEDYHYPHAYLSREKASQLVPGQWCAVPPAGG
jgi:ribosomal protein S18 acetylase RimI-like enzyme